MLYRLLNNQAYRNQLENYVNNNNNNNDNDYDTDVSYIPQTAMADIEFTNLYQSIQRQYFPNEKMNTLTSTFNMKSNYFTASQAKQLIQLVSLESNRLQLAKLSYRTIIDRVNFSQVYDLFTEQSNRNDLDNYIRTYKDGI
jgi:hypothetical protein